MEQIVQIFKALSDETRLKILIIISKRKICAKGIARHLNISEAAVSQHIKILKDAHIIVGEKKGYYVHYNLKESTLSEVSNFIEQVKDEHSMLGRKLDVHIPDRCEANCRTKKCCKKITDK